MPKQELRIVGTMQRGRRSSQGVAGLIPCECGAASLAIIRGAASWRNGPPQAHERANQMLNASVEAILKEKGCRQGVRWGGVGTTAEGQAGRQGDGKVGHLLLGTMVVTNSGSVMQLPSNSARVLCWCI